jgi:hypothetical protein
MNYIKLENEKQYTLKQPFYQKWYKIDDRLTKYKLGKLYESKIKDQKDAIARFVDLERNSIFNIERF